MRRLKFKLTIVEAGLPNQAVAYRANAHLPEVEQLSEIDISKIITGRKTPSPAQKVSLSAVLGKSVAEIFPATEE